MLDTGRPRKARVSTSSGGLFGGGDSDDGDGSEGDDAERDARNRRASPGAPMSLDGLKAVAGTCTHMRVWFSTT